jgi:hypothetical protein
MQPLPRETTGRRQAMPGLMVPTHPVPETRLADVKWYIGDKLEAAG